MNNLTFRVKLILVLAISVTGLVLLTLVAMNGLRMQQQTNNQVQRLALVNGQLDTLAVNALQFRERLRNVSAANEAELMSDFESELAGLDEQLVIDRERLDAESVAAELTAFYDYYERFVSLSQQVIESGSEIGFRREEGLRGEVLAAGAELQEATGFLSMARDQLTAVRDAENLFLSDGSSANWENFRVQYEAFFDGLVNLNLEDRFADEFDQYLAAAERYRVASVSAQSLADELATVLTGLGQQQTVVDASLTEVISEAREEAEQSSVMAISALIIGSLIIGGIVALVIISITVSVRGTLRQIMSDLQAIQNGDLTARMTVNHRRNDEFDQLSTSVNGMAEGLGSLVSDMAQSSRDSAERIRQLRDEINRLNESNQQVNDQTDSVAASTEEISATVSDVAKTTQSLAAQAEQTNQAASEGAGKLRDALSSLRETGRVVRETSAKLDELGTLSNDIDSVIEMINELTGQTNLLALNAAIEAARAGDAGRGFSVVADEVRSLAERTVDATGRITHIVDTIQASSQAAIKTMASGREYLEAVEARSGEAETAMHTIEGEAQSSAAAAQQMANSVQEVAKATQEISQEMDRAAQRVREDTQSIQAITRNASDAASLLEELDRKAAHFTVN